MGLWSLTPIMLSVPSYTGDGTLQGHFSALGHLVKFEKMIFCLSPY